MSTTHLAAVASVVALLAFAAVSARAAEGPGVPAVESTAPVKIVCFGDSITEGMCATDPTTKSYPAVLQVLLDDKYGKGRFHVVNAGISGQDTRQGLKRLDALLASERPDWILMEYGTNDIWTTRNMAPESSRANLTEMLKRMKAARAKVIMATLPPVWHDDAKIAERSQVIKDVATEQGVYLIDLNAILEKGMADAGGRDDEKAWLKFYYYDKNDKEYVHPNDFGYAFLAGEWLKAFEGALEKESAKAK